MGRPSKQTVDFFSHDCMHTKTMEILEGRFGTTGYTLWWKLLEALGSTEGHVIDFSDDLLLEHFSGVRNRISVPETLQILDFLSRLGAIDLELWENRVVWCQHFVDRLADVYAKRKRLLPVKPSIRDGNPIDSPESAAQLDFRGQESTKESRVKESIGEGIEKVESAPEKPKPKRATRLPTNFVLSEDLKSYAVERHLDPTRELEAFADHHRANQKSVFLDWEAAWRTWCRKAIEFGRGNAPSRPIPPKSSSPTRCRNHLTCSSGGMIDPETGLCGPCFRKANPQPASISGLIGGVKGIPEGETTRDERQRKLREQAAELPREEQPWE